MRRVFRAGLAALLALAAADLLLLVGSTTLTEDGRTAGFMQKAMAQIACGSIPYVFVNGTVIDATQVNANFNALLSCITASIAGNSVPDNTTLLLKSTASYPNGIWRNDFAANVGAAALFYRAGTGACALASGAGDNGSQVRSSNGRCWLAEFPPGPVDVRQWGSIGNADDTALWTQINSSMCDASWPSGVPKIAYMPAKTTNVLNFKPTCLSIAGAPGAENTSIINLAVAANNTTDLLIEYLGTGPFSIENVTIQCPRYDPANTGTRVKGVHALRVGDVLGSTVQAEYVRLRHVRTIGCLESVRLVGVRYVDIDHVTGDSSQQSSLIVADSNDTAAVHTEQIRIDHYYGVNPGEYCISMPVNGSNVTLASRVLHVGPNVDCEGAGFIGQKQCYDLTGSSYDDGYFHVTCRNAFNGGAEVKRAQISASETPIGIHRVDYRVVYGGSYDQGWGMVVENAVAGATSAAVSDINAEVFATWTEAPARLASTYYSKGQFFAASGGNDYQVMESGTTAAGAGPTTTALGQADGSAVVSYRQPHVTVPANLACAYLGAVTRVHLKTTCYNMAYGVLLSMSGGSDNTIASVDMDWTMVGIRKSVMVDINPASGNGAVSGMRIRGSASSAGDGGASMLDLCQTSAMSYGDLEFENVRLTTTGTSSQALLRNNGCANFGTTGSPVRIHGGHWTASNRIMYLQGPSVVRVDGGAWDLTNVASGQAIEATAGFSSGLVDLTTPVSLTSARPVGDAEYGGWLNAGAGLIYVNQLIRGFVNDTAPVNTTCNYGDFYANLAHSAANPQGFWCTTPGTAGAAAWTAN